MCLSSPKSPTIQQTVAPPPAEAPAPLALPDGEAMSVASLRLAGRNSLRTRKGPASPTGGASASASSGATGGTSGTGSSSSGSVAAGGGGSGGGSRGSHIVYQR